MYVLSHICTCILTQLPVGILRKCNFSCCCSESESRSVTSDSLRPYGLYSPGQNTGVGSHSLLQGMFPIQGLNPGLPHCRRILYQLSHKGSPRMLKWVAYPFSRGSFWPRNQSRVSWIAGGFFTTCAIEKASRINYIMQFSPFNQQLMSYNLDWKLTQVSKMLWRLNKTPHQMSSH